MFLYSSPMMKKILDKSMEIVTLYMTLSCRNDTLVEILIVMEMMILWMRTSKLINKRLQMLRMCSCQLYNLQMMILQNLVCWAVAKDDGKVISICAQFLMATLTNLILSKLVV